MYTFLIVSPEVTDIQTMQLSVLPEAGDLLLFNEQERSISKVVLTDTRSNLGIGAVNITAQLHLAPESVDLEHVL